MLYSSEENGFDLKASIPMHHRYQRRSVSSVSFFEDEANLFHSSEVSSVASEYDKKLGKISTQISQVDVETSEHEDLLSHSNEEDIFVHSTILDASILNDFPAKYQVYNLESHQLPVIGVYVDPKIVPGFKYRVQCLNGKDQNNYKDKYLFHKKSLTLLSIGRGYARRLTFEQNKARPEEENYFYSDNNPEGYAFELDVISAGNKFTIFDANHEARGILEVIKADKKQLEINSIYKNKAIEKRIKVKFTARAEFYDTGISQQIRLNGIVICHKDRSENCAKTTKIIDINVKHRKYYLIPGYEENCRHIHVKGEDIGDVPTRYTITGLMPYEIPVIGTYVDPRILPGFRYKVRPTNRKQHLFKGKSLKLQSIGLGYAKKLTFESDSAVNPDNYLWSDSYQDGLAFESRAVCEKMKFSIMAGEQRLGEAEVFRADLPQIEERMEKIKLTNNTCSYVKYVHVDVMCHVKIDINDSGVFHNENLMRIYGLAVVKKESNTREAHLERIENIGLDSHLNVLFTHVDREITFVPIK